jgi:predicted N-acetyltransferase YhbS
MTLPVRRLKLDDLPACLDLAADREWPREERKWRLLFEVGEVYGIVEPGEGVVGTTIVTRYEPGAAISMVLVAARRERRGLGGRMMRHALERTGPGPVVLYATEYGRPLYERNGFAVVGAATAHAGWWRPEPNGIPPVSRPATPADTRAIAALDAAVFGSDRGRLVGRLPEFAEQVRVAERDGATAGYTATWRNIDTVHIGPVVAADEAMARALIAETAAGVDGPVRIDLGHERPDLRAWVAGHGLEPRFAVSLMAVDGRLPDGDPQRQFAPLMQALG